MDTAKIIAQHQARVNSIVAQRMEQVKLDQQKLDLEKSKKEAEFNKFKPLIDKVYFAFTLSRADEDSLNKWTQMLVDGVNPSDLVAYFRSLDVSGYFGANAEKSINSAFFSLFGRTATEAEKVRYLSMDVDWIPAMVALDAQGADADTMTMRMQFSKSVRDYYKNSGIPTDYGLPAMKAKEQMQTLYAGLFSDKAMELAVRNLGDFLADWVRVAKKPESVSDLEPPKGEYKWTGTDYGVVFYEPATASSSGRLVFTFDEPVDWSAMDSNKNGRLDIGTELNLILSNPAILGDLVTVNVEYGVNDIVIDLGVGAVVPKKFGEKDGLGNLIQDSVVVTGVADYQGNSGSALFAFHV